MTGTVDIPEAAPAGTLFVRVERVDRADAPAEIVARTSVRVPAPGNVPRALPFELQVRAPDPGARYTVRAHLAATAGFEISPDVRRGDYVSTVAYPVLGRGHGSHVQVALRRVD